MFDFGIAGYRPTWLDGRSDVVRRHGNRLRGLVEPDAHESLDSLGPQG